MRRTFLALSAAAALMLCIPAAQAHHSFASTYDVRKLMTLKGTMAQVSLRFPHSFFYVDVAESDGKVQRWVIEGSPGNQYAQQGTDKEAIKVGDPVEVIVNPARSPSVTRARLIKLTRTTDGKSYEAGAGD